MELAKTYRIETERLVIRCYQPEDACMLRNAIIESKQHLLPWMPWAHHQPEELETTISTMRNFRGQFDLGKDYFFGIFDKTETEIIGSTGLHTRVGGNGREIGYWIHVNHINKGLATEAVRALTKTGFEIEKLSYIEIHCSPQNIRSQNIPQKLGYRLQGQKEQASAENPEEVMVWAMFRSDYLLTSIHAAEISAYDVLGREIRY